MHIKDNGIGLPSDLDKTRGLGILGIKERAHILGGEIDIVSKENEGTEIIVNIPVIRDITK